MSEPELLGEAHFWIGSLAVIAGFAAFGARKGAALHRAVGVIIVLSIVLLTLSGLWLSIAREILFTVFLSVIVFHAVVTGWASSTFDPASLAHGVFILPGDRHLLFRQQSRPARDVADTDFSVSPGSCGRDVDGFLCVPGTVFKPRV